MTQLLKITIAILFFLHVSCIENGLGRTPQMGWNPWNKFACGINENLMKQMMDALVSSGLAEAGYVHFNLDDCWQSSRDPVTHRIIPDPQGFPSGMKALADYAHSKGLKFGLYSDAGFKTCQGRPGSLGYEEIDAQQYAEWDVDYLKYDNCYTDGSSPKVRYPPMAKALMKQQKKIFFSMCEWGVEKPHEWARELANSWRTTGDIEDKWSSFINILDQQDGLEKYAGPGGWNDPDMLEVGNGGMTTIEYQSHFALWSLIKAPLLIGCDITNMSQDTKKILLNKEVIAINQDPLGIQGKRVKKHLDWDVWSGVVHDGLAVILFNRGSKQKVLSVSFSDLGLKYETATVRDLINKTNLPVANKSFSATVESHGVVMVKLKQFQQKE